MIADRKLYVYLGLLAGFGVGASVFRGGSLPDSGWVGGVVAVAAGLVLLRPRWAGVAGLCGGLLAGILSGLMQFHGLPLPVALAAAVLLPALTLVLASRNPRFAPPVLCEEALLLMLVLGLGAAVVPAVVDGWRSAGALNVAVAQGVAHAIPAWALALSGVSVMLGGAWSLWRHR